MDAVEKRLEAMDRYLRRIEDGIGDTKTGLLSELDSVKAELQVAVERLARLENSHAALQEDMDCSDALLNAVAEAYDGLAGRLDAIDGAGGADVDG